MGRQQSIPGKTPDASQERRSAGHQPALADGAPRHDILALQQTIGNRAVAHFLGSVQLQPKLRIGPQGDSFEQEADRMADAIVGGGPSFGAAFSEVPGSRVQRMCTECEKEEEELRRQPVDGAAAPAEPALTRDQMPRGGAPLGKSLRSFFEPRFGRDFSGVRIHTGDQAAQAANAVKARAFTVGPEIVFGAGEYRPETTAGQRLLAHELTHVVQQARPASSSGGTVQRVTQDENAAPAPETAPAAPAADTTAAGPTPAADSAAARPAQQQEAAVPGLVVEDSVADAGPTQMRKSEFLDALRTSVTAAVDDALTGTGQTSQDCPWIDHWFGYYGAQDAAHVERAIRKFAPETAGVADAGGYIDVVTARVRRSVATWATTGEMPDLPEGATAELPGAGATDGVNAKARPGGARDAGNPLAIRARLGRGQPLEGGLRSRMESAFGVSFSHVRTHTDQPASALSDRLNARAFAVGEHVAFSAGEYRPGTPMGDALIAHELAHVVQQGGGQASTMAEPGGGGVQDALEHDADNAAVGAVVSFLGGAKGAWRNLRKDALPLLKTGLGLQRCPKKSAPAAAGGLSAGSISGGVSGLSMNVTVSYTDCTDCKDGLEAVQVFWGTRRTDGVQVGTHQRVFPPLAATYDSFVDGGSNSPGGAVYGGSHPYYIGRADLPATYAYVGGQGSAGSVSGCTANPSDAPGAATLHQQAFFETAIACLNYQGKGSDKLLDAFKWGYVSLGTVQQPSPTSAPSTSLATSSTPSAEFEETLKADYPGYTHV
jgi:hypothetical protein